MPHPRAILVLTLTCGLLATGTLPLEAGLTPGVDAMYTNHPAAAFGVPQSSLVVAQHSNRRVSDNTPLPPDVTPEKARTADHFFREGVENFNLGQFREADACFTLCLRHNASHLEAKIQQRRTQAILKTRPEWVRRVPTLKRIPVQNFNVKEASLGSVVQFLKKIYEERRAADPSLPALNILEEYDPAQARELTFNFSNSSWWDIFLASTRAAGINVRVEEAAIILSSPLATTPSP